MASEDVLDSEDSDGEFRIHNVADKNVMIVQKEGGFQLRKSALGGKPTFTTFPSTKTNKQHLSHNFLANQYDEKGTLEKPIALEDRDSFAKQVVDNRQSSFGGVKADSFLGEIGNEDEDAQDQEMEDAC